MPAPRSGPGAGWSAPCWRWPPWGSAPWASTGIPSALAKTAGSLVEEYHRRGRQRLGARPTSRSTRHGTARRRATRITASSTTAAITTTSRGLPSRSTTRRSTRATCWCSRRPRAPYSVGEIDAIQRFVQRGGGLMLIGEHTDVFGTGTSPEQRGRAVRLPFRFDCLFGVDSVFEEHYDRPLVPHPMIQYMPALDFAISCSIDPGTSSGPGGRSATRD